MSKFLDLNGLSHYNEKIQEVIENKKGVHLFPCTYDVEYDNVDCAGDIVTNLREAIDDNKLIVVKGDSGVVPCSYTYSIPEEDITVGATLVIIIGSVTKIENSIVTTVSFEITLVIPEGGGIKLNNKVTTVSYDISEKEICVIEYPLADIGNTTMLIPYYTGDEIINAAINNKPIYVKIKESDQRYFLFLGDVILEDYSEQRKDVIIKCLWSCGISNKLITTKEYVLQLSTEGRTDINNSKSDYILGLGINELTTDISNCITNISVTPNDSNIKLNLNKKGGTTSNVTIPAATTEKAGIMTAADKTKLDSLDNELFVLKTELPEIGNLSLDELATRGLNLNKIYVVPSNNEIEGDIYEEFIIRNDSADNEGSFFWERLGSGKAETDLKNYEPSIPVIVITYNKVYNPLETSINEFQCNKTYQELLDIISKKILVKLYTKQGNYLGSTIDAIISPKSDDSGDYVELSFRYHGSSELRYTKNYFEIGTYKARASGTTEATSVCDDLVDASRVIDVNSLVNSEEAHAGNAFIFKTIVEGNYDYILYGNIYGNVEGPHGNTLTCYGSTFTSSGDIIEKKSININLYDDGKCSIDTTYTDYDVNTVKDFPDILNLITPNTTLEEEFIKRIYRVYVDFRDNNRVYRVKKGVFYGNIIDIQYNGPSNEESAIHGIFTITYICGDYLYKINIQSEGAVSTHQKYSIINNVLNISTIVSSPVPSEVNREIYNTIINAALETAVYNEYYGKIVLLGTTVTFIGNSIENHTGVNLRVKTVNIVLEYNGTTTITYDDKIIKRSYTIKISNGDAITDEHIDLYSRALRKEIDLNINFQGNIYKVGGFFVYQNTGLDLTIYRNVYSGTNVSTIIFHCKHNPGTSSENYVYSFTQKNYSIYFPTGTLTGGKYLNDLGNFEDPFNTIILNRATGSPHIDEDNLNKIIEICNNGTIKYIVSYGGQYNGFGWGTNIQQTTDAAEDTHYILRVYDTDVLTRTKPVILEIDVNATAKTVSYTEIPIITDNDVITNTEIDDLFN